MQIRVGVRLHILVVTQYFWPENFRINDIVSGLVDLGHEVTVLTGLPNYPEGRIYQDFTRNPCHFSSYAGARIIRVPMLPRGVGKIRLALNYLSFAISGLILGSWRLRGLPFDAIFVFQTSPITVALPALWLGRCKRAPVLMWVLDLWPETLLAVGALKSRYLLDLVGCLVSFIYRRCDRILVQSRAFISNVKKHGGHPDRIRYFPNWAEPIFKAALNEGPIAEELAPYLHTFNVLFAGNIGEAQDFPAILDAAETLKGRTDIRLLVLGDGRAADWVRSEIQRRGLEHSVIMLGRHPLERMPSFFRGAHALLVSLKNDPIFTLTIPGKVQSYLASGLPLLGMLDGEGARVIEEAGAGLVCPTGQGQSLADNIRRLVDMPQALRIAMGERGRKCTRLEFDRETLFITLESWITELVLSEKIVPD